MHNSKRYLSFNTRSRYRNVIHGFYTTMSQSSISGVTTVLVCCVWYTLLSFTSQMTKFVLGKMPYPLLLAQIQYSISGLLSFGMMRLFRILPQFHRLFPPGCAVIDPNIPLFRKYVFLKILPLGLLQSSSKYLSLCATQIVLVATVASIKALSPLLLVLGYRVFYNVKLPVKTYLLLAPLLGGVIMIILADTAESTDLLGSSFLQHIDPEHVKGILYCVVSVVFMATHQIYGKELITWDQKPSSDTALHVLNSDPDGTTTPKTPHGHYLGLPSADVGKSTHAQFFLMLPKTIAKNFTQRSSNERLPYSVSDLNLNELNPHSRANPYVVEAEEARISTNPFVALAPNAGTIKPDKLTVILYVAVIGFCTSSVGFLSKEAPELYLAMRDSSQYKGSVESRSDILMVAGLILLVSLCHFAQALISFILLGLIPALSYSIASMMKRIVIIVISLVLAGTTRGTGEGKWFGRVTSQQMLGLMLLGIGLYSYDKWGSLATKRPRT